MLLQLIVEIVFGFMVTIAATAFVVELALTTVEDLCWHFFGRGHTK